MSKTIDLFSIIGFEWNEGNITKNKVKHNVDTNECEEVFCNKVLITFDSAHSQDEERYTAYGITSNGRQLYVIFTVRGEKIRVISARDQDRRERSIYEQYIKNT